MNCNRFAAFPNKTRELFVWVGFSVKLTSFLIRTNCTKYIHKAMQVLLYWMHALFLRCKKGHRLPDHLPHTSPAPVSAKGGKGHPAEVIRKVQRLTSSASATMTEEHTGSTWPRVLSSPSVARTSWGASAVFRIQASALCYAKSLILSLSQHEVAHSPRGNQAQSPETNPQYPGSPPIPLSACWCHRRVALKVFAEIKVIE